MLEFSRTPYGKRFFDSQLPKLISNLERIADAMESKNKEIEGECLWVHGEANHEWKPECDKNSTYNVFGVAWFKRCPYCGRHIKLKEEE